MKTKWIKVLLILAVVLIGWGVKSKFASQQTIVESYEHKIIELNQVETTAADEVNRTFLERFFTYESMLDRYEVGDITTADCYASLFPSGKVESDSGLSSELTSCDSYKKEESKDTISFLNQLQITIKVGGKETVQHTIFKTELKFVDGVWKVNEISFEED